MSADRRSWWLGFAIYLIMGSVNTSMWLGYMAPGGLGATAAVVLSALGARFLMGPRPG